MSFINSLFYGKYGEGIRYLFIGGLNVIISKYLVFIDSEEKSSD